MIEGKDLIKLLAFLHLFDGTQGSNSGIIRAVGAQLYGSIAMFIGFYVVGTPIGLSLLFKTNIKAYGFFIGVFIGLVVLIILQVIYIFRIDWIQKALEAHEFAKVKPVNEESNNDIQMINPVYETTNEKLAELNQIENNEIANKPASKVIIKEVFKRLSIFILLIIVLLISIYLHESDLGRNHRSNSN